MLWLLPIWLCLFLLLVGAGLLATTALARLGGESFRAPLGTFQVFWFGYALTILFLTLYSLLLPIQWPAPLALSVAAGVGFWSARHAVAARLRSWRARPRLAIALALTTLLVVLVVAGRAAQPVGWYDTHLYHLQVVSWARTFPAVPGIANLHYRLAYNNGIHLFGALTDCFMAGCASQIAIGFLASVVAVQLIACVLRPSHQRSRGQAAYALLTLPFVLGRIASNEVASLSSDLPLNLLCIVIGLELFRLPRLTPRRADMSLALALTLAAVATTTKLGGVGVLAVCGAVTLHALHTRAWPKAPLLAFALLPGLLLLAYFARQAVLSGWLLFPAPIGNLHLPWSLPEAQALDQFRWIQSWARMPGREPAEVLDHGFGHWFRPWFHRRFSDSQELVVLAFLGLVATYRSAQAKAEQDPWHKAALAAALVSLIVWFRGAPDLRFGAGFFWILLAVVAAPLLARTLTEPTGRALSLALSLALTNWTGGLSAELPHPDYRVRPVPMAVPPLQQVEVSPGLKVNVPVGDSDRCGNAPIPCTPLPVHQRLRRPNDLGSGFLY